MTTITISGVPEHFNLPWHLCIEEGLFEKENINLNWQNVPEGTGKMCQMLRDRETDMAVILTEGIVKDITLGNPSKIVQVYVQSPLIWGIHVASNSNYFAISDLLNKKAAISRFGSGSHLMAYVNAKKQGWAIDNLEFEIVNTIEGAVESLTNHSADYFMWERFMTKPIVDSGVFRRIGDCPTPWPCFVIAVRNEILENYPELVKNILKIINKKTIDFKHITNIDALLSSRYNLKKDDVTEWLSVTEWSQENLSENQLLEVQNQLYNLEIINKKLTFERIVK